MEYEMKYAIIAILVFVMAASVSAADYPPGSYLRVVEIVGPYDIPIDIWIAAADKADAESKLPAVLAEHFVGKAYEAHYHQHYLDRPCTWELLATGTYTP